MSKKDKDGKKQVAEAAAVVVKQTKKVNAIEQEMARLVADIQKRHGDGIITTGDKVPDIQRLPTGIHKLDKILRGGLPMGRIVEFWGPVSAGKSSLVFKVVGHVQRMNPGARIAYYDLENTYDKAWARRCGADPARLLRVGAVSAEEAGDLLLRMVRDKWDMVIVDSLVELIPESVLEKETGKQTYAPVANVLSSLLPKVVVLQSSSPTIVILINQVRDMIGFTMGKGKKAPGGNALYHLDSIRLRLQRKEPITGALVEDSWLKLLKAVGINKIRPKENYGYTLAIKVVKSKVSREGAQCRLPVLFDIGILNEGGGKHAKEDSSAVHSSGNVAPTLDTR